jgi:hypothetical protein
MHEIFIIDGVTFIHIRNSVPIPPLPAQLHKGSVLKPLRPTRATLLYAFISLMDRLALDFSE